MAIKFPPHTFESTPVRWTFTAGGSVVEVPESKSIACERCPATMSAAITGPAGYQAIADFLWAHAGTTCGAAARPRARRAA